MLTYPINHFSGQKLPATQMYTDAGEMARTTNILSGTFDIGPEPEAGQTRHVLISVFISEPSPSTVLTFSIGGFTTTLLMEDLAAGDGGGAVFIAEVPTGTSVTISGTLDVNANYCGGEVYAIYDLESATPVNTWQGKTESTVVSVSGVSETKDGVLIAMSGYWANVASTYAWSGTSGVVEDFDGPISGTNELFGSSASKDSTADASGLTVQGNAAAFDDRGHRLFVLEMR